MKYDDDELAEAAILLALEEQNEPVPAALASTILAQGKAIAADVRFTTTKGAALSVEPEMEVKALRRPNVAAWVGWAAAAACFAFGVYEWRISSLSRGAPARSETASPSALVVRDGAGAEIAAVVREDADHGALRVVKLPANTAGEHYRLWLADGDASRARVVGTFDCATECQRVDFGVDKESIPTRPTQAWITHNRADEPASSLDPSRIVGKSTNP